MIKPTWIWRGSDFELYHYFMMTKRRKQRENRIFPDWTMDRPEYLTSFVTEYKAEKDSFFSVEHSGEITVKVNDSQIFSENVGGKYFLPAGKGKVEINCLEDKTFPMIFIDSEYLITDKTWSVLLFNNEWGQASCLDEFCTKEKSPLTFEFDKVKILPESAEKLEGGILYDFGRELMGLPKILLSKEENIVLCYGESKSEALDLDFCEVISTHYAKSGEYTYPEESKGFRYLFVKTTADVLDFFVEEEKYIPPFDSYFVSNDEQLNKIYEVAKYTLELTSREFFIDGIKRDRWVWAGDVLQSEWFDFYAFDDNEIVKRSLRALIGSREITSNVNSILDYNFYFVLSVYYYYVFTGDKSFVEEMYPRLVSLMNFVFKKPHVDGLLQARNEWIFIDWVDIENFVEVNNSYPICLIQILYWASLNIMATFSKLLGKDGNVYIDRATQIKRKTMETFFDTNVGFYHDANKQLITKYGNIFAILLGFLDKEQVRVIKEIDKNKFQEIYTPYMKFYESCMCAEIGCIDSVLSYLKDYWGGMLNEGATTFWERYDPNEKGDEKYAMYDRRYGKSLCHSWGAGPIYLLSKYIVGLSPAKEGYIKYKLAPYLSSLTFNCKLPMNGSSIEIKYDGNYLMVYSKDKDGILLGDRFVSDNLNYDDKEKGYILKKDVLYKIKVKG